MTSQHRIASACLLLALLPASLAVHAADRSPFVEGQQYGGRLNYINGLPVLVVAGTPEEIGRQKAALTGNAVGQMLDYPKQLLKLLGHAKQWPTMVERSQALAANIRPEYRVEMTTFAELTEMKLELGLVANTMLDVFVGGFNCSSLMVEPDRSATKGLLFGRNLDYFTLHILDRYSLVTVCRPNGKHAFVSIGFPGLFDCLSGMNDAGLCPSSAQPMKVLDLKPLFMGPKRN